MATAYGTGLGGVITTVSLTNFTVASWTFTSITGYSESVAVLDDTHLGSSIFMESLPSSLAEIAEITASVHWDYQEDTLFSGASTALTVGDANTLTISLPERGGATAGTLSGTAFITNVTPPDWTTGNRSIGSFTFKFDGKTGPTWTAGTP